MLDMIRDHNGVERKLGWVRPSPETRKLRAVSRMTVEEWRVQNGQSPLIPRSEWIPIDLVTGTPTSLIIDQGSLGSCTACSAVGAMMRIQYSRGINPIVKLSHCALYDMINGGRDAGSNIGEANDVIRSRGVPPLESYPQCLFRTDRFPENVSYWKELGPHLRVESFDALVTLILMGGIAQTPVDAGGNFGNFDVDGVSRGSGGSPNHSIIIAGIGNVGGKWRPKIVNSWGLWGPTREGWCWGTETQLNNCGYEDSSGHVLVEHPR